MTNDTTLHATIEPPAMTLDTQGYICDCNSAAAALFGSHPGELVDGHISRLLPGLANIEWIQDGRPNQRIAFLSHIGHQFEAIDRNKTRFNVSLFLIDLGNSSDCSLRLIVRPTHRVSQKRGSARQCVTELHTLQRTNSADAQKSRAGLPTRSMTPKCVESN